MESAKLNTNNRAKAAAFWTFIHFLAENIEKSLVTVMEDVPE